MIDSLHQQENNNQLQQTNIQQLNNIQQHDRTTIITLII